MKTIIYAILILTISYGYSSGEIIEPCDHTYSVFYDDVTQSIVIGCAGDQSSLELIVYNPVTQSINSRYPIDGLLQGVESIDGGLNYLVLLAELDGDFSTHDSALQKIDSTTGAIIPGFELLVDRIPLNMAIDSTSNYAYILFKRSMEKDALIKKVELMNFNQNSTDLNLEILSDQCALTNDDQKLYFNPMKNGLDEEGITFSYIQSVDISDMSLDSVILLEHFTPSSFQMGVDNRLFISNSLPSIEDNNDNSLVIINTDDDSIMQMISLDEKGIGDLCINPISSRLYGTILFKDAYDPITNRTYHRTTATIVTFDLTDVNYTPNYFTIDDEGLWDLALAYQLTECTLFASAEESNLIHYLDL